MNTIVRTATHSDITALLLLYEDLTADPEPCRPDAAERALTALLAIPGSAIYVVEQDGACVAACTLIVIPNLTRGGRPFALIENVVTHHLYRRRGYAKAALTAASNAALQAGCYKVMLMTGRVDEGIISFYESAGYSQSKTGFQMRQIPARKS